MALATPTRWRLVLLTSALLSLLQVLVSTGIAESPAWLAGNGKAQEARAVRSSLAPHSQKPRARKTNRKKTNMRT